MCKRAPTVDITQRVDGIDVGSELVIYGDKPTVVDHNPGLIEAKFVGVGHPAHREQYVRTGHLARLVVAVQADGNAVARLRQCDALCTDLNIDVFVSEYFGDGVAHVFVFAPEQTLTHLDDGYPAAKTTKHLTELESHIAAADYDQVLWDILQFHHLDVREVFDIPNTWNVRHPRPRSHVDVHALALDDLVTDSNGPRSFKKCVLLVDIQILGVGQPVFETIVRPGDDCVLSRLDALHVDPYIVPDNDAEVGTATGEVRNLCACHHRLCRCAPIVDTRSTKTRSLDDGRLVSRARQA